jgi:hypothetical protein
MTADNSNSVPVNPFAGGGGSVSERWYMYWLQKAALAERSGNLFGLNGAYFCLAKAEKHTGDEDELFHLRIWMKRLKEQDHKRSV